MTSIQLKNAIAGLLPTWMVTISEQYMLNVQADELDQYAGFIYIEELNSAVVTDRRGHRVRTTHDVYFCRLHELDSTAEQREDIRESIIMPAVRAVEHALVSMGITTFKRDKFPRGFDANEVLVHLNFESEDIECY